MKYRIAVLSIIWLLLQVSFAAGQEGWLEKGIKSYKLQFYERSAEELQKAADENPKQKEAWFYLGCAYFRLNKLKESAEYFKKAVKLDRHYKEAWNGYGKTLMHMDWLPDKNMRAIWQFRKALAIDPDYQEAVQNFALAKIHAGAKEEGVDALEELLKRDYKDAGVMIQLAQSYEQFLRYGDTEMLNTIIRLYQDALKQEPENPAALKGLGLAYLLNRQYQPALMTLVRAEKAVPDDDAVVFGKAVAAYKLRNYSYAEEAFHQGIGLISGDLKPLYTGKVTHPADRIPVEALEADSLEQFWKKQDPDPFTPENERLLEREYRAAYSRLFFPEDSTWDARGRVMLLYGDPDDRFGGRVTFPKEYWFYYNLDYLIQFSKRGTYKLGQVSLISESQKVRIIRTEADGLEQLVSPEDIADEEYTPDFAEAPLPFVYDIEQFKGERGLTECEVTLAFPVIHLREAGMAKNAADITLSVMLSDDNAKEVLRKQFPVTIPAEEIYREGADAVFSRIIFDVPPGEYNYYFSAAFPEANKRELYRGNLKTESFAPASLKLSSLKWAASISPERKASPFNRNGFELIPYPVRVYNKTIPAAMYIEIYNLGLDSDSRSDYEIKYAIQKHDNGKFNPVKIISNFLTRKSGKDAVITGSFEQRGDAADDYYAITKDISALDNGVYRIGITVKDRITGAERSAESLFAVSDDIPSIFTDDKYAVLNEKRPLAGLVTESKKAKDNASRSQMGIGAFSVNNNVYKNPFSAYDIADEQNFDKFLDHYLLKNDADGINYLARKVAENGNYEEAVKLLEKGLAFDKKNADMRFNLALTYLKMEQYDKAREMFEELVKENPAGDAELYGYLAFIHVLQQKEIVKKVRKEYAHKQFTKILNRADVPFKHPMLRTGVDYVIPAQNVKANLYDFAAVEEFIAKGKQIDEHEPMLNFARGIVHYFRVEIDSARESFKEAIEYNPGFSSAYHYLGVIYNNTGALQKARNALVTALSLEPESPDIMLSLATNYYRTGEGDEAMRMLSDVIRKHPKFADAYFELGNILYNIDEIEEAKEKWDRTIELDPEHHQAENNIGVYYLTRDENNAAYKHFMNALDINPLYYRTYNNIGRSLRKQGMLKKAKEYYNKALMLNQYFAEAHNNIGEVYFLEESYDLARNEFISASSIRPDYAESHNNLGVIYLKEYNLEDAEMEFKQALRLRDNFKIPIANLGVIARLKGEYRKSQELLEKALKIDPEYIYALKELCLTLVYFVDREKIFEITDRILKISDKDPDVYYIRGLAYIWKNDYRLAAENLKYAVKKGVNSPQAYFSLAETLEKIGKNGDAKRYYRKFIKVAGDREYFADKVRKAKQRMADM